MFKNNDNALSSLETPSAGDRDQTRALFMLQSWTQRGTKASSEVSEILGMIFILVSENFLTELGWNPHFKSHRTPAVGEDRNAGFMQIWKQYC